MILDGLLKRWRVTKSGLLLILCVFAITGTATAYISKAVTGWVGFTAATPWFWKLLVRLAVLVFGYQIILLSVAFLLGQFSFFWRFEKRMLGKLGLMRPKDSAKESTTKKSRT